MVVRCGVPELVEAMDREEIAITAAAEIAHLPVEEQRKALAARGETPRLIIHQNATARFTGKPKRKRAAPGERRPGPSPSQARDTAIDQFSKVLHAKTPETFDDIPRLVRNEQRRIMEISIYRRVANAREHLAAIGVTVDDLRSPAP